MQRRIMRVGDDICPDVRISARSLQKAGFANIKPRAYTDREILSALKKLAREKGGMPTFHELVAASKAGKCPAPGTILKRIGKLTDLKDRIYPNR